MAPAERGRGCAGCLFKGGLGCGSFLAGVVIVVLALAPTLMGDWVSAQLEQHFDDTFAGRVELGSLDLAWTDRQVATGTILFDPEGREIARGTITGPALFDLADENSAPELNWVFETDEARLIRGADGTTNLERTFALTDPGRVQTEEARRRGRFFGRRWGIGRQTVRLELRVARVTQETADGEHLVAADVEGHALFVPGGPAGVDLTARLPERPGPGGEVGAAQGEGALQLQLAFPAAGWWRAANAPFDLEFEAHGLGAEWLPGLASAPDAFVDLELSVRRTPDGVGTLELTRGISGGRAVVGQGTFVAPRLTQPGAWSAGPPIEAAEVSAVLRGWTFEPQVTATLGLAWSDEGPHPLELRAEVQRPNVQSPQAQDPDVDSSPTWSVRVQVPAVRCGSDGPGGVWRNARATWSGQAANASMRLDLEADGVRGHIEGPPSRWHLPSGPARLTFDPPRLPRWLRSLVPVFEDVSVPPDGAVRLALDRLGWPAFDSPAENSAEWTAAGRLDLSGATVRLAEPLSGLLATDTLRLAGSGQVGFELGGDLLRWDAVDLAGDGFEVRVGGHWNVRNGELDLTVSAPSSLVVPGVVPFLDEHRDLIGAGVEVPLVVTGTVRDVRYEVDPAYRAEVLETALGSMREVVDFFEERVRAPLGAETQDLLDQLGALLQRSDGQGAASGSTTD